MDRKAPDQIVEEASEFLDRYLAHVPKQAKDPSLVVLKGHLLSEELIWQFVKSRFRNPEYLEGSRFGYIHMLNIARAMCDKDMHEKWVWEGLKKLNSLRNDFGHSLEPKNVSEKIDGFIKYVDAFAKRGEAARSYGELYAAILSLLIGLMVSFQVQTVEPLTRQSSSGR